MFSMDTNNVLKRYDELKNKVRDELKDELRAINGGGESATTGISKGQQKAGTKADKPKHAVDTTDYFELVYECIHTRKNFLNIISLNSRSPFEPDIDLVILQALLNGRNH
jgi:hypothetical protein